MTTVRSGFSGEGTPFAFNNGAVSPPTEAGKSASKYIKKSKAAKEEKAAMLPPINEKYITNPINKPIPTVD